MLKTSITMAQIRLLETTFATLTPRGWRIPDWLIVLRKAAKGKK
jgi:hypothetical protein